MNVECGAGSVDVLAIRMGVDPVGAPLGPFFDGEGVDVFRSITSIINQPNERGRERERRTYKSLAKIPQSHY